MSPSVSPWKSPSGSWELWASGPRAPWVSFQLACPGTARASVGFRVQKGSNLSLPLFYRIWFIVGVRVNRVQELVLVM